MGEKVTKSTYAIQVLRILEQYSDQGHPLKQEMILRRLGELYGEDFRKEDGKEWKMNRKTIADAVNYLRKLGYEDRIAEGEGGGIYLRDRRFKTEEALLLSSLLLEAKGLSNKEKRELLDKIWEDQSDFTRLALLDPMKEKLPEVPGEKGRLETILDAKENGHALVIMRAKDGTPRPHLFIPMDFRLSEKGPEIGGFLSIIDDRPEPTYEWIPFSSIPSVREWKPGMGEGNPSRLEQARDKRLRDRKVPLLQEREGTNLPRLYIYEDKTLLLAYSEGPFSSEDAEKALEILQKKRLLPKGACTIQEIANALPRIERTQEGLGALLVLLTGIILGESFTSEEVHDALLIARHAYSRFLPLGEWGSRFYYSLLRHLLFGQRRDIALKAVQRRSLAEPPPLWPDLLCEFVTDEKEWDALYERVKNRPCPWLHALLYVYLVNFSGTKGFSKKTIEGILSVSIPPEGYLSPALRVAWERLDPRVRTDEKRHEYVYNVASDKNLMIELLQSI